MNKLAIISPELTIGGAETMAVRLAASIDKDKYKVLFICLGEDKGTALDIKLKEEKIDIIYLGKTKSKSVKSILRLYRILSKFKPDIIHSHIAGTLYAIPWVFMHNRVCVHTVHTKPNCEFSGKTYKVIRYLIKHNKMIICAVSQENRQLALEYYKCNEKNIRYVNNPVDISSYYNNILGDGKIRIINVSRQDENKNQILILKALPELIKNFPNVLVILVGDGNQHNNLVEYVEKHNLSEYVIFTGQIPNVQDYLAISDIYISCSHREGLPLSMIEAMASKLPIVSSDVGGIRDLIDGNGFLFEDNDIDEMIRCLGKLCSNSEMSKEYGEKSYNIVQQYDVSMCAEKYQRIYEEHIKK